MSLAKLQEEGLVWRAESDNLPRKSGAPPLLHAPFGVPEIDNELSGGGLSPGVLHEWFSDTPPLTVISILLGNSLRTLSTANHTTTNHLKDWNRYIFWIGEECWPTPYLLHRTLPDPQLLSRSLFVAPKTQEERFWAIDVALRSEGTFAVIASLPKLTLSRSKRFALAAQESMQEERNRFAFFLRPKKEQHITSVAATRWEVAPTVPATTAQHQSSTPTWKLSLLKQKGQQSQKRNWSIELSEEDFGAALSLNISPKLPQTRDRSATRAA